MESAPSGALAIVHFVQRKARRSFKSSIRRVSFSVDTENPAIHGHRAAATQRGTRLKGSPRNRITRSAFPRDPPFRRMNSSQRPGGFLLTPAKGMRVRNPRVRRPTCSPGAQCFQCNPIAISPPLGASVHLGPILLAIGHYANVPKPSDSAKGVSALVISLDSSDHRAPPGRFWQGVEPPGRRRRAVRPACRSCCHAPGLCSTRPAPFEKS